MTPKKFANLDKIEMLDGFTDLSVDLVQKQEQNIYSLLTFLGYTGCEKIALSPDMVRESIYPLAQNAPKTFIFIESDIREKIVSLRLRIGNRRFLEIAKDLSDKRKQNKVLKDQINEKEMLQGLVKKRAGELRQKLNQMREAEVNDVAPYLFYIFSKLVKHSTLDGFQFEGNNAKETDTKLTFTDGSKNPILNIISEGQLDAFMLSCLLGNAFLRKETENSIVTLSMTLLTVWMTLIWFPL